MQATIVLTTPYLYYVAMCFAFIITGVICSIIRWTHMCHPYDEHADYFYPARKQMTTMYAGVLLQFPYLIYPQDPDTWFFIRSFGLIYYGLWIVMVFMRYFDRKKLYYSKAGQVITYISGFYLAYMFCISLKPSTQATGITYNIMYTATVVLGTLLCLLCLKQLHSLRKKIQNYHYNNFSSEDEFPLRFAVKVIYMPLVWLLIMWIVFFTGSRTVKCIFDAITIIWIVAFLVTILHPQRALIPTKGEDKIKQIVSDETEKIVAEKREIEESNDDEEENAGITSAANNDKGSSAATNHAADENIEAIEAIKAEIESIIIGKKRFLDTRYNLDALADEITSCGRTKLSKICTKHMNGFYYIVNRPRVEYAEEYKLQHPNATKQEIALASGFTSRDNYKHAIGVVERINKSRGFS